MAAATTLAEAAALHQLRFSLQVCSASVVRVLLPTRALVKLP